MPYKDPEVAREKARERAARRYAELGSKAWRERRPTQRVRKPVEERRAVARAYRQTHKAKIAAHTARRKAARLQATPAWADQEAIAEVYAQAQDATELTGVEHQVDHIFPLRGKTICGLHVETNLRVVTREENRAKGNRLVKGLV